MRKRGRDLRGRQVGWKGTSSGQAATWVKKHDIFEELSILANDSGFDDIYLVQQTLLKV